MIQLRPVQSLYHVDGGWFSANWHFSFDHYVDPENTRFGGLRVFNDDRLIPGAIWPMHPHRDIEASPTWPRARSATRTRWEMAASCVQDRCSARRWARG